MIRETTFTEEEAQLLRKAVYHSDEQVLELSMDKGGNIPRQYKKDGDIHQYEDVPEYVYEELLDSDSKEEYIVDNIMHDYESILSPEEHDFLKLTS